jgi:hypothetical protein
MADSLIKNLALEKIQQIIIAAEESEKEADMPNPEETKWRRLFELVDILPPGEKTELTLLRMLGSGGITLAEARSKNGKLLVSANSTTDFIIRSGDLANSFKRGLAMLGIDPPPT